MPDWGPPSPYGKGWTAQIAGHSKDLLTPHQPYHSAAPSPISLSETGVIVTNLKGIFSMKPHRDLGITQKSAWFLAHRIGETFEFAWLHGFNGPIEPQLRIRGPGEGVSFVVPALFVVPTKAGIQTESLKLSPHRVPTILSQQGFSEVQDCGRGGQCFLRRCTMDSRESGNDGEGCR